MSGRVLLAVGAARPAARPALALRQILCCPPNMLGLGLGPFWRGDPADPFIARERGNILPLFPRRRVGNKGFS